MFSVDFETIYQIIQQLLYTGVFRAQVAATRTFSEEGYIELQVKEGVIYGCYFVSDYGKTYKWDHRDSRFPQLGVLDWEMMPEPSSKSSLQMSSPSSLSGSEQSSTIGQNQSSSEILYHAVALPPAQLQQWPMLHRQVYSLIDGRRRPSEIAQILHKEQPKIERIIQDLRQQGFIQVR